MNRAELPLRVDEIIGRLAMPDLLPISAMRLGAGDCLVMCSGFEARALAILRSAIHSGSDNFTLINIDYLPEYPENQGEKVLELCQGKNIHITKMVYDRQNPAGMGKTILEASKNCAKHHIDISGMSRLLITQVLVELAQFPEQFRNASIFYSEAKAYPPTRIEFEKDCAQSQETGRAVDSFISSGVHEVAITPELSSVAMHGQAIRLVAFPSFNREQLVVLLQEVQPAFVNLIEGMPPLEENAWRIDAIRTLNEPCIRSLVHEVETVSTSTLDYRETLRCLLAVYDKYGASDKIVVAPTGSKLQSVAVGLFRAFMKDVQIVYPTPQLFSSPERHTQGVGGLYVLPLSSFSDVPS